MPCAESDFRVGLLTAPVPAAVFFAPWRFEVELCVGLGVAALLYARGWWILHRRDPERFPGWRLLCFAAGLAAVLYATASPLDALADFSLRAHMFQHVLLMFVAPPLVWLGEPLVPLLRGLPPRVRKEGLGPFLAWPALRRALRAVTHPAFAWCAFVGTMWLWHVPALYELALREPGWHELEHGLFFASALLFWFPIVQPRPSRPRWPRAAMLVYLGLAAVQNTVFSAVFAFSNQVLYPSYADAGPLLGIDPLADQAAGGALLWVLGMLAMAPALAASTLAALETRGVQPARGATPRRAPRTWSPPLFDLLRAPGIGRALRSRGTRRAAQALMCLLAAALIADGLWGPAEPGANLAGVLPWTWWRGLVVVALLVAGNVFCWACPFTLPRGAAHRISRRSGFGRIPWPRRLRSKWLAVALVGLYLVVYEVFDVWAVPAWTAWIALTYFAAAFGVDLLFRGASFCKYICPIGQFHFSQAALSPLEVRVRDPQTCARCATHDCVRGGPGGPGCGLDLALPTKRGNFDCTFCLDCVRACPHDNVGLLPARRSDAVADATRSGVGRWSRRGDWAALALVFAFGAFANAAGMVAPVAAWERESATALGLASSRPVTALWLVAALTLVPFGLSLGAAALGAHWARYRDPWRGVARRLAVALVPLGFAMWFSHFGFHLLSAGGSALLVFERAFAAVGVGWVTRNGAATGVPGWESASAWWLHMEIGILGVGLLVTLRWGWRVCEELVPEMRRALALCAPWGALAVGLYAVGVWILLQPMEMRGMAM